MSTNIINCTHKHSGPHHHLHTPPTPTKRLQYYCRHVLSIRHGFRFRLLLKVRLINYKPKVSKHIAAGTDRVRFYPRTVGLTAAKFLHDVRKIAIKTAAVLFCLRSQDSVSFPCLRQRTLRQCFYHQRTYNHVNQFFISTSYVVIHMHGTCCYIEPGQLATLFRLVFYQN